MVASAAADTAAAAGPLAALLVVCALLGGGTSVGRARGDGRPRRRHDDDHDRHRAHRDDASERPPPALDARRSTPRRRPAWSTSLARRVLGPRRLAVRRRAEQSAHRDRHRLRRRHEGHIVTAAHVVDGARRSPSSSQDGTTRTATVLGKDDATDIAVLKIDASGLKLTRSRSAARRRSTSATEVAAIGDPFGYARSISTGIVSGVDRTIQAPNGFTVAHAIQTDAAINPGNSGGPMLDADGRRDRHRRPDRHRRQRRAELRRRLRGADRPRQVRARPRWRRAASSTPTSASRRPTARRAPRAPPSARSAPAGPPPARACAPATS